MSLANEVIEFVTTHPTEKPGDSFQHSGSSRVHYGLSNPTMRNFVKTWSKQHPGFSYDQWVETMTDLYRGESIDEVCIAGFMLEHYRSYRSKLPLNTLDKWIGLLEGWREIDTTCQSTFSSKEVLARWNEWEALLSQLPSRNYISHRRASLVLTLKSIRQSSDVRPIKRALANIDLLNQEEDKLITKAISWVLRTAIKHHRTTVVDYVNSNKELLPSIALREFQKKLDTGKK